MAKKKSESIDPRLVEVMKGVTGKRPRTVLDHIIKHGYITTDDLANYGYKHAPRAVRDVREAGVPLETYRVKSQDGRSIAAYRFGDPTSIQHHKLGGRSTLPKDLLARLYESSEGRCYGCFCAYEQRYLQVDHRVPYEIAGEPSEAADSSAFMLLCGSCQRKKSWSCEHCINWIMRDERTCAGCFWSSPEDYTHIATKPIRRVELTFEGELEVALYERLTQATERSELPLPDLIKRMLAREPEA